MLDDCMVAVGQWQHYDQYANSPVVGIVSSCSSSSYFAAAAAMHHSPIMFVRMQVLKELCNFLFWVNCELEEILFLGVKNPGWKPSCTAYILTLPQKQRRINMSHWLHSILRHLKKLSFSRVLVKMSASCSFVEIHLILMSLDLLKDVCTLLWKWWYLIAICFVQGVNFKDPTTAIVDKLSSWYMLQKSVIGFGVSKMQLISLTRF